jgi:hypothetical protein
MLFALLLIPTAALIFQQLINQLKNPGPLPPNTHRPLPPCTVILLRTATASAYVLVSSVGISILNPLLPHILSSLLSGTLGFLLLRRRNRL